MKNYIILAISIFLISLDARSQHTIQGKVMDENGQSMAVADVSLLETGVHVLSDESGLFTFYDLKPGRFTVRVSFVGYADKHAAVYLTESKSAYVELRLSVEAIIGNEVVVTASRRPEKLVNAPASISTITAQDVSKTSFFNPGELISKVQGIEFARSGVNFFSINSRGFNSAYNTKVLFMTDGRNSMMAGANGLASGVINTVIKEDIDRIEIELGPNSALYGPNAHNGIFNTLTKDPRQHPGTTITMSAGNQQVFSTRFRHATKINERWAYKLTGEYTSGRNFTFYDSVYAGGGVYGPSVVIPEKIPDPKFSHLRTEAHLFYSLKPESFFVASYGGSVNDYINVNNIARTQQQNWKFSFLQVRFVSPRVFVQLYETWTNAGQSYNITSYTRDYWNRTHSTITDPSDPRFTTMGYMLTDQAESYALRLGNRLKEKSRRLNAEGQYNYDFEKLGLFAVGSLSYQKDNPKTYGTTLADENHTIQVSQFGSALLLEKTLPASFKMIAAARLDHHSLFGNMFSPKLGIVKKVSNGTVRLTWARAFAAPILLFQRASAFGIVFGNGSGVKYIPNGSKVQEINVTDPIQPEQITTWELGYKAKIATKLFVDINGYYGNSEHFLSPAISIGGRVLNVGDIPVRIDHLAVPGKVDEQGILTGATFSTYFNYGKVGSYGLDLGMNYTLSRHIQASFKYSWFGSDITRNNIKNDANKDGYVSLEERSLNAARNRFSTTFSFNSLFKGKAFANISARWVQEFDMYSGNQIATKAGKGKRGLVYAGTNPVDGAPRFFVKNFDRGPLGGFTTVDLNLGYRFSKIITVNAGVGNLFNTEQREFVASPSIHRLFSLELVVSL